MKPGDVDWFGSIVQAGSILTGFCATFLAFRIQREAQFKENERRLTTAFIIILAATFCSGVFGLVLPLLGLIRRDISPTLVVAGMITTLVLLCVYVWDELIHYQILKQKCWSRLNEKKRIFWIAGMVALVSFFVIWFGA